MKVGDVMTHEVVTVPPGASLKEAAHLLVEHRISGLPVVDTENHVLGVLSEADVLPKEAAGLQPHTPLAWLPGLGAEADRSKLEARLVGEAMTTPAVTIEPQRPVALAATRMIERGVNRLPVVDEGRLVGIVSRADLMRAFVRTDAEIAEEIRDDVVVRGLRLERHSVQVEVEDGEVTLTGTLDSGADAQSLAALASRVAGVVGVHSRLAWTDGDTEC
jgi:CBS domain-containing protein